MHQRLAAVAAVLLAPSLAVAQTVTGVAVDETNPPAQTPSIINMDECSGKVQDGLKFRWTLGDQTFTQSGGGGVWNLAISDKQNCPTDNTANTTVIGPNLPVTSQTGNFPLSGTYAVTAAMGNVGYGSCPASATVMFICVSWTPASGAVVTNPVLTGSLKLDLAVPPAPSTPVVTPADSGLRVSWTQGTGSPDAGTVGSAASYKVYYQPHTGSTPFVDITTAPSVAVTGAGTLDTRIGGLTNGTPYDVVVTALGAGLNESAASPAVTGVPVEVLDFWRAYQNDGGRELGGCSSGAASLLALLALVPIAIGARRANRRRS